MMRMKRIICFLLSIILLISLGACTPEAAPKPDKTTKPTKGNQTPDVPPSSPTDREIAQGLIDEGKVDEAYAFLQESKDEDAKKMLENFAFTPLFCSELNETHEYSYDDTGRLLKYVHQIMEKPYYEESYTYHENGLVRTLQKIDKEGTYFSTYDDSGKLITHEEQYPTGKWLNKECTYDKKGNLLSSVMNFSDGSFVDDSYSYDYLGNCTSRCTLTNRGMTVYQYTYDNRNRKTYEEITTNSGVEKRWYTYNDQDQLIKEETIRANGFKVVQTLTYDEEGRVTRSTYSENDKTPSVTTTVYDSNGNLTLREYIGSDGWTDRDAYIFDQHGNLVEYHVTYDGVTQEHYFWTYNEWGQLLTMLKQEIEYDDFNIRYEYENDESNRPVKVTKYRFEDILSERHEYTYDQYGQIVSVKIYNFDGYQFVDYAITYQLRYYPEGVSDVIRDTYDQIAYQFELQMYV